MVSFQVTTPVLFTFQGAFQKSNLNNADWDIVYAALFSADSSCYPIQGVAPIMSFGYRSYMASAGMTYTPAATAGSFSGTLSPGIYYFEMQLNSTAFVDPPLSFSAQRSTSGSVSLSVQNDSDSDSLPDEWELAHFGSLGHSGSDDADGDGEDNTFKFIAGTDPADASAHLILKPVRSSPASRVFQLNQVRPGIRCRLESSTELAAWDTVTTQTFQNTGPGEIRDDRPGTAEAARRFYRVRVEP